MTPRRPAQLIDRQPRRPVRQEGSHAVRVDLDMRDAERERKRWERSARGRQPPRFGRAG